MKTLIAFVTYGNLDFTKLLVRGIRETDSHRCDLFAIVGKPGDTETAQWMDAEGIPHFTHNANKGFPASLNDALDYAFGNYDYDAILVAGNDVVPYPNAIDSMRRCAGETDFEWISASQFDVQSLVAMYPQAARFFNGPRFEFSDFDQRPWALHEQAAMACVPRADSNPDGPALIKDVQNFCLYKRSVFNRIGYFDANFWPNGYFSDNDYARRGVLAGLKCCALAHAQYFHFWSRTIHQGEATRPNNVFFDRNEAYYREKWGGGFGAETADQEPLLCIPGRGHEQAIIEKWSTL